MLERLRFYLTHSLNDMRVNKQRTFYALLCIAAGVAAIVSLQTLGVMIDRTLTGSLAEVNRGDLSITANNTMSRGGEELIIEEEDGSFFGETLFTAEGVQFIEDWLDNNGYPADVTYQQVLPQLGGIQVDVPARDTARFLIVPLVVVSEEYPLYGTIEDEDGNTLSELLNDPNDLVLSQLLADDLEAEIGDVIRLSGATQDFVVSGIVPSDSEPGLQNSFVHLLGYYYLDVRSVELFDDAEMGHAGRVMVRLEDPSQVDAAQADLERRFGALNVTSTTDVLEMNEDVSATLDDLLVVMGLVSLLIGGIGIVNTMLVIVSRRTTEIAVMKTLGLEPQEITYLFLVEAILMGIIGSVLGVPLGWLLNLAIKGVGEGFLGQELEFVFAFTPALNGLIVGVVVTAIFGFLPTLAAGSIRPANVLRPSDTVIPRSGRLQSIMAITVLIMALSVVAQSLLTDFLDSVFSGDAQSISAIVGVVYGGIVALTWVLNDFLSMRSDRRGRSWGVHMLMWPVVLVGAVVGGFLFGNTITALMVLTGAVIIIGYLYILLWLVIWALAGGRVREIFPGILVLLFPLFWPLIPLVIVMVVPLWIIGWLIQRYTFIDFKIAMRAMLSSKGRGATTLLGLVIGVFTLSLITMMVELFSNVLENFTEDLAGGNVMIVTLGGEDDLNRVRDILAEETDAVRSYAIIDSFPAKLEAIYDASAGRELTRSEINSNQWQFDQIEGRDLGGNLPGLDFSEGRQLDPRRDNQPDADGYWPVVVTGDIESDSYITEYQAGVGDRITMRIEGHPVYLEVVGVSSEEGISFGDGDLYAPRAAFEDLQPETSYAIADIDENKIKQVRRRLFEVEGTFILETRLFNDLINRLLDKFTSLPIMVATLTLITGGVVIANSVALSTLERRREIGVMKAVGLQRERVLGMLLLENSLMGLVGGLIGVGIGLAALVGYTIIDQEFGDFVGDAIPYGTGFTLMGLCIVIAVVAAIASVWGASGEKPLNVLRYE